jgi:hypothetical protein
MTLMDLGLGLGLGVRGRCACRAVEAACPDSAEPAFPAPIATRRSNSNSNLNLNLNFRSLASAMMAALLLAASTTGIQAQNNTHLLIISGLGGEPAYSQSFLGYGKLLKQAAIDRYGVRAENITLLAEKADADALVDGRAGKPEIEQAFAALAARSSAGDPVMVVLIGHGSFNGGTARLSLPGPDLSAEEFAALLDRLDGRRVALVNTASASGAFIEAAAKPGRAVLTATKSGQERNQTIFPRHFVSAFAEDVADTDKDGRVSLLEAFVYAQAEVERSYEQDGRLMTEHAVLEDNGDGTAVAEPGGEDSSDGAFSAAFFLGAGRAVAASAPPADASPQLQGLYAEKARLEQQIAQLRASKAGMPEAEYQKQLEALLVELALNTQEIRKLEGKAP